MKIKYYEVVQYKKIRPDIWTSSIYLERTKTMKRFFKKFKAHEYKKSLRIHEKIVYKIHCVTIKVEK